MAILQDLIGQIDDPDLRERISQETNKLLKQKKFGLVFEEHLPECTPLYDVAIRKGSTVAKKTGSISELYLVAAIHDGIAACVNKATQEALDIPLSELVSVASFGEPIYPYLKRMDSVQNAANSDLWHTLIEADNYHALQLLEYLYAGKVDCIYIDPPYNTGAKDWKYNNDYVDSSDTYRHSKWLSMMEKRLRLAKKLLNPANSVLIVIIDEKEYLHLGCLLEEIFPNAKMQMITSRINKKASTRFGQFARCDEYIFILQLGNMKIQKSKYSMLDVSDNSNPDAKEAKTDTIWNSMLRRGSEGSSRRESPNLFYPVWIDEKAKRIEAVGNPLPLDVDRHDVEKNPPKPGLRAVWPIRTDDSEGRWQLGFDTLKSYLEQGIAKLGAYNKKRDQWAIVFLKKKQKEQLADGILVSKPLSHRIRADIGWRFRNPVCFRIAGTSADGNHSRAGSPSAERTAADRFCSCSTAACWRGDTARSGADDICPVHRPRGHHKIQQRSGLSHLYGEKYSNQQLPKIPAESGGSADAE